MKTRVKLGVLWGVIMTSAILAISSLFNLFEAGRRNEFSRGRMGFEGGGFRHHQWIYSQHDEGGIHWLAVLLFLIIGLAVVIFFIKWLRKNDVTTSLEQLIDTTTMSSHTPVVNHNATILDQWEQNRWNKKENE